MHAVYVAQKAVIINGDNRVLVLLRGATAPTNPLKWDLPGGDLEFGEDPLVGIAREVGEETGLSGIVFVPFDVEAHVDEKGEYWTTIAYKARLGGQNAEVRISWEHNEYRWVTFNEFLQLECSPKVERFVVHYYKGLSG